MKKVLKKITEKSPVQAQILNLSDKDIWVIETSTKKKGYDAVAHLLKPGMKSPIDLDIDGFMRADGGSIESHRSWWKIPDLSQVIIYSRGSRVKAISLFGKKKVSKNEFGKKVFYDKSNWGVKIIQVLSVRRDKDKKIVSYYVEDVGWVSKSTAIQMAIDGKIDNVVVVDGPYGVYLRTRPDSDIFNNFSSMG